MNLAIRNNNPGNLRPVGGDGFRSFQTPDEGLEAMYQDLMAKVSGKSNAMRSAYGEGYNPTLESLLSVYAPSSENDTQNYIQFVADKTGIDPSKPLTVEDIDTFMPAMIEMEGGKESLDHFYALPEGFEIVEEIDELPEGFEALPDGFEVVDREYGRIDSAGMGMADMASFGFDDEVRGFGRALGTKIKGDERPFTELLDLGINEVRQEQDRAQEDNPASYFGGQMAGTIGPGAAAAKGISSVAKLSKYARNNPLRFASATGGISGGVYGLGSGEEGLANRLEEGALTGSMGAAAGPVGARIGQSVGGLFERAQRVFGNKLAKTASQADSLANVKTTPIKQAAEMQTGEVLPMTKGQFTQDPSRQALEISARKGGYGKEAQDLMLKSDMTQQGAIRSALGEAGSDDDLINAGNMVQRAYKNQKAKVSKAYDNAEAIKGVYVNKSPISEQLVPKVKDTLNKFNLDMRDLSPEGKQLYKDLGLLKSDKITAVNLAKMEKWRGKASNIVSNNNVVKGNAVEGAAFRQIVEDYDRFMAKLPEDALKSGDEDALQAILKARGERRAQGVLFERNKVVRDIVQSQDITDEELANMILTGSGRAEKINSGSGRLVKNLKRAVGDKAPELQNGIKRGTLARMLQRATGTVTEGDSATRTIDPAKLRNEFDALVKNKTFMKEVFSEQEIDTINAIHRDLNKIGSEKPGTNNYSNTAYALMRFVNIVPFGKASIGDALNSLGEGVAAKDIRKGLSPVLDGMINELNVSRFYGASASRPTAAAIAGSIPEFDIGPSQEGFDPSLYQEE